MKFKNIAKIGLWSRKGKDGGTFYSGSIDIDNIEFREIESAERAWFFVRKNNNKKSDKSPDVILTIAKMSDEGDDLYSKKDDEDDVPF